MRTKKIRKKIEKALDHESRTGKVAEIVREVARLNGRRPKDAEVEGAVEFFSNYAAHVPHCLEQASAVARKLGLKRQLEQMGNELAAYWSRKHDVIPDHQGLIGIMDDAYASLRLLQSVSEYCQQNVGRPLLSEDLSHANTAIRQFIGEPAASQLDQMVGVTIANAMMQQLMQQITAGAPLPLNFAPDPVWGNATMDEVVDARLGAMGVV